VRRQKLVVYILVGLVASFALPGIVAAQGPPLEDAAVDAGAAAAPPITPAPLATPSSSSESAPRPMRGPAVRERGGRRSRGASAASGALMLFVLIAFMGYYVVKKLRR
jgi:hypothetical protein